MRAPAGGSWTGDAAHAGRRGDGGFLIGGDHASGEPQNQDAFPWNPLEGVGKIYVQVAVDIFCSLAFAEVYRSKTPITACDPNRPEFSGRSVG